jgi:tetratricopeptide (TPR) repeat protein
LWNRAIRLSSRYFPALFNLGYFYFQQQKFAEAEPLLSRAAESSRDDFNAHYLLGVTLLKLQRPEDALRAWRDALRIQPGNLRLMQVMSVEYSKGRYFGEAAALAKKALALKSDDPNLYFLAIKAYQDAGDDTAAGEIAKRAVEKFPDSTRANFEYAFHLKKNGAIPEALERLRAAMKADPTYEEPFFFYGNLLVDQGKSAEAIPYLRKAIEDRTDYVPARVVLARALMNLGKWDDAIAELSETIRLDPKHPQPHLLLSQIYFRLKDEARAKSEKQISLRLRRENPTILEAMQARPFPVK